jgi:hypothetical protein
VLGRAGGLFTKWPHSYRAELNSRYYADTLSSNGNDIEPKRNDASVIEVFSVAKRNEPTCSRTWKDRNEANTIINIRCRIEEITNIISPEFAGSKIKRI